MPAPSPKRRRLSSPTLDVTQQDHDDFVSYASTLGVKINGVGPRSLPGRGIGLVALQPLKAGAVLISVPPAAMLVPASSQASSLSPQAKLTGTLLSLAASGDERYKSCARVWPSQDAFRSSLAWFEPADDNMRHKELFPQALAAAYDRLLKDAASDAEALGRDAADAEFLYHWAIANTRSFSFKPIGRKEGTMVCCPVLDYMNHCSSGQGCEVKVSSKGYSLVADRNYNKGDEILATYGAHSNDKLLAHYGFCMSDNGDDSISLDAVILPQITADQRTTLQSVGYLGNYSLTPGTGEVCFRTQVAVRSVLLTSNEWEFYMNSGEDIADDKSAAVRKWMVEKIQASTPEMTTKREALDKARSSGHGHADVLAAIVQRWDEILSALRDYVNA